MLYISTRVDNDVYTAHKTMIGDQAKNGGVYAPFSLPNFSTEEIADLKNKQFNQVVSEILNLFFSARLTELDINFALGKKPCVIHAMNHRIAVAELWHNSGKNYDYLAQRLYSKLCNNEGCSEEPTDWAKIAVDIAILFGVYAESLRDGVIELGQLIDISADTERFSAICAAWYARKMGLPIGTIICTEKGSGAIWDLIHRGSFSVIQANTVIVRGIERLLFEMLDADAAQRFVDCVENRQTFMITEDERAVFSDGFFCSVAGSDRAAAVINSVFRSNTYTIDQEAALCYGGLQDYRARNGEGRLTLLFGRYAPAAEG